MTLLELKQIIDLEQFILAHGYYVYKKKSTKKTPVLTNGSEFLVIRQGNDCKTYYVSESSEKGTVIDFLINRDYLLDKTDLPVLERARLYLLSYTGRHDFTSNKLAIQTVELDIESYRGAYPIELMRNPYLLKRGITFSELNGFFSNIGFYDYCGFLNIAFPYYSEDCEIRAIEYRYFLRGESMKMFVPGSEKTKSIGLSRFCLNPDTIVLCESPIDAMSHYILNKPQNPLYIYFAGTLTRGQLEVFLELLCKLNSTPLIVSAFDRDVQSNPKGQLYTLSIVLTLLSGSPVVFGYEKDGYCFFADGENILANKENINSLINEFAGQLTSFKIEWPTLKDWNEDLMKRKEITDYHT